MKRFVRLLTAGLLSALMSVNVLAFMQARAMTNFAGTGERTRRPDQLSLLAVAADVSSEPDVIILFETVDESLGPIASVSLARDG